MYFELAHSRLALAGCGLSLIGAIILLITDAWFSRSVLIYLDALEESLNRLIEVLQKRGIEFENASIDLRRDRGQNRARFSKLLGWIFMTLGIAGQLIALSQSNP